MGSCQNYGPLLGALNIRCRIIIGIQKGTIILTTTHVHVSSTPSMMATILLSVRGFKKRDKPEVTAGSARAGCSFKHVLFWGFCTTCVSQEKSSSAPSGPMPHIWLAFSGVLVSVLALNSFSQRSPGSSTAFKGPQLQESI